MAEQDASRTARAKRVGATQAQILTTAEQLFAEYGVSTVSNRQISEAAGQGNNAVVGYHFGVKSDLVRAIARKHSEPIERARLRMLDEVGDSTNLQDWVACLVLPMTEHLAALGNPTWYARFVVQVATDPALRKIVLEEALASPAVQRILDGLNRCLPDMPLEVHFERGDMARYLMLHACADYERALAEGTPRARSTWQEMASGLVDAVAGLWQAPVTPV